MKTKIIQIVLGAVGSIAALLIQHFAGIGGDPMLTVVAGSLATVMLPSSS